MYGFHVQYTSLCKTYESLQLVLHSSMLKDEKIVLLKSELKGYFCLENGKGNF